MTISPEALINHINTLMSSKRSKEAVVPAPGGQPAPLPPVGGSPGQAIPPAGMPMDPAMMGGGMPPMDPAMMGGGMPPEGPPAEPGSESTAPPEIQEIQGTLQSLVDGQTAIIEFLVGMTAPPEGAATPGGETPAGPSAAPPAGEGMMPPVGAESPTGMPAEASLPPQKLSQLVASELAAEAGLDPEDDTAAINRVQNELRQ